MENNIQKYFSVPIKKLQEADGYILITLDDDTKLLYPKQEQCIACGRFSFQSPLCKISDQDIFLCADCAVHIVENFGNAGVPIDLNISKAMPKLAEQVNSLVKEA